MTDLDLRKTASFRFGQDGPACLLLHGFSGTPWDLKPLAEALQTRGFSGEVPCLPGHGRSPEAMRGVCYEDWLRHADRALQTLAEQRGEPVRVAGFSMGGLLGLALAARRPAHVSALALLAPAAGLLGLSLKLVRLLRHLPVPRERLPLLRKGPPDLEDAQERDQAPSLDRIPLESLLELFALQDLAYDLVPYVRANALLVVAAHDHVVDANAARRLYGRLPRIQPEVSLPRGFHGLSRDFCGAQLAEAVGTFFSQHS
jgi:carboxylesterase